MDPREEQKSLKNDPLPLEGGDENIPTRIVAIDDEIEEIQSTIGMWQKKLSDCLTDRKALLDRAIELKSFDDGTCIITKTIEKGNRVADPAKLKLVSGDKWNIYVAAIKEKAVTEAKILIQKAKDGLDTNVNLGIADKVFGKKTVDECSTRPETTHYEVKKK